MNITRVNSLKGEIKIPGDKSISHRAIMLGAIAEGTTEIHNFLLGADCLSTIDCFRNMGIEIIVENTLVKVNGKGMRGLTKPDSILDVGNSGTTTRLICGILAAQNFTCSLNGDESIQKRPMKRVIEPLTLMGADISSHNNSGCTPLTIKGTNLKAITYHSKIASAQVKSAILLAGLYATGITSVTEPFLSRNHTELMLDYFGAKIKTIESGVSIFPCEKLSANQVIVPGDISSAAYFMASGLITANSEVLVKDVGINPTRNGIIKVIKDMGGDIQTLNKRLYGAEEVADILVKSSSLKGITIGGSIIPSIIDEIPIIAILACFANGQTIIKDASELKVKESNRIDAMVNNLLKMGADIKATDDGMIINGGKPLIGAVIDSHSDHRIAMSFAIAGLNADGETKILGSECINISYPSFYQDLQSLI